MDIWIGIEVSNFALSKFANVSYLIIGLGNFIYNLIWYLYLYWIIDYIEYKWYDTNINSDLSYNYGVTFVHLDALNMAFHVLNSRLLKLYFCRYIFFKLDSNSIIIIFDLT